MGRKSACMKSRHFSQCMMRYALALFINKNVYLDRSDLLYSKKMNRDSANLRCIRISVNGSVEDIAHSQYDEETYDRIYSCSALLLTERWGHEPYKLSFIM